MAKRIVEVSRVFTEIVRTPLRIVVNEGSARSTKTFSILQFIINECLKSQTTVTIARARLTWLKATIIPDFKELMSDKFMGLWNEDDWSVTDTEYTFPNGSIISFIGLDQPQKLQGRKQDIAWINEAIEADLKSFQQLVIRTIRKILLDYNPSEEQHWIYSKVVTRNDCHFIKSTYKDNPFISQDIVDEIERFEPTPFNIAQGTADEVAWKIYGLGERAAHRGLIFGDSKIVKDMPSTDSWKISCYGLDFGFTNDPTACIHIVLAHGELWLDQMFYEKGLVNLKGDNVKNKKSIEDQFEESGVKKSDNIGADSGEPKSIKDLQDAGYSVRGAVKGPDSVRNGLMALKKYKINITERSLDLIKERNAYKWKEDKEGNPTNEPIDMFNHGWDAVRYGFTTFIKKGGISFEELNNFFD